MVDLLDQLRAKDVFDLSNVSYAILETNGSLSVLQKCAYQTPTAQDLGLPLKNDEGLAYMLVLDGVISERAVHSTGVSRDWVLEQLKKAGIRGPRDVFFAQLTPDGTLFIQQRQTNGARQTVLETEAKKHAV